VEELTHDEILNQLNDAQRKVLEKQCEWVGITVDDIDLCKRDWYTDYSWSEEEKESFEDWIVDYLKNNSKARQEFLRYETTDEEQLYKAAGRGSLGWTFNYGWTMESYNQEGNEDE
jgi:hypothetical protein